VVAHPIADRIVDVASVALMSAAAVLSAICSYQAGRWSGEQTYLYNIANTQRSAASEATNRSLALTAIDVNLFLNYVSAMDVDDKRKTDFIYRRLRPQMRTALDAWAATRPLKNPDAPSSPFVMPEYTEPIHEAAHKYEVVAKQSFSNAQMATHRSDDFLQGTVIFAAVSFLAGMSTKMQFPRHAIVVTVGALALIYGIVRLVGLPFL
jgi:hypothetical protein